MDSLGRNYQTGRPRAFFDAVENCRGCSCIPVRSALSTGEVEGLWHHEECEQRYRTGDWQEDRREQAHEASETPESESREENDY